MSSRKLVGGELKKWFTNVNSQTPHTQGDMDGGENIYVYQ